MAAINGVHGPGSVARSETTIISAPVTKPVRGPYTNPSTKVRVSVNPTAIKTPYSGVGDTRPSWSKAIRETAPIATNVET